MKKSLSNNNLSPNFKKIAAEITSIGLNWHSRTILENSKRNKKFITQSISDIKKPTGKKSESAIIISAGPCLYRCGMAIFYLSKEVMRIH